jgi:transposase
MFIDFQVQLKAVKLQDLALEKVKIDHKLKVLNMLTDEEFYECETIRSQFRFVLKYLRYVDDRMSWEQIAEIFKISRHAAYRHAKNAEKDQKPIGRPPILNAEMIEFIVTTIQEMYDKKTPATYFQLIDMVQFKYGIFIKPDTFRHVCRALPGIRAIRGVPKDSKRVNIDSEEVIQWYATLSEKIADVPAAFIYNVDETGCNDYVDAVEMIVLVPDEYEANTIDIPVDRNSKRATLVACISGDGMALKPLVILPRKTIEDDIFLHGYNSKNTSFCYQENAFMTMSIFLLWAEEVFFPAVEAKREEMGYSGNAILILDGLSAHHSEVLLAACADRKVEVVFLVPHSSHLTQPLDLVTFGLLKAAYVRSISGNLETRQSNQVVKMLTAHHCATSPRHVMSAFAAAGLRAYHMDGHIFFRIESTDTGVPIRTQGQRLLQAIRPKRFSLV